MVAPWSDPPTYDDFFAGSAVLSAMAVQNAGSLQDALDAVSPGPAFGLTGDVTVPPVVYQVTDDYVLVAVGGTNTEIQWILHFLGSNQVTNPMGKGHVNDYFSQTALNIAAALDENVGPDLQNKRLVFIGHSFGGAIVQLLGSYYQDQPNKGITCITYGSPSVGDKAFADSLKFTVYRVQTTGDPVPTFPPALWWGQSTPWTFPYNLRAAEYVKAGRPRSLEQDGSLGTTENEMDFFDAVLVVAAGEFKPHLIEEYMRLLTRKAQPDQPPNDFNDPALMVANGKFLLGLFPQPGGGTSVALTQAIMYFKSNEFVAGWGESWCTGLDLKTALAKLQDLAKIRANSLATTISIHAFKVSDIDPNRARNSSIVKRLDTPIQGKAAGQNIKAQAQNTNETMDAIDYQIKSATNSTRVFPFRGVPDTWIEASARSADGVTGCDKIEAYLASCSTNGWGFKIYDRTVKPKQIQTIQNDPVSGLLVIGAPGHTLEPNDLVQIRAFRPNPMINGRWKVGQKDANTFTLVGSDRFQADASNMGTWQKYTLKIDTIQSYEFIVCSTRRTGRPFGSLRGRRSARLLHH